MRSLKPCWTEEQDVIAYLRQDESQTILVAANFRKEAAALTIPAPSASLLLSNLPVDLQGSVLTLQSGQAAVLLLEGGEKK